jgi:ABC-type lipoprotein release transport system permease subunit
LGKFHRHLVEKGQRRIAGNTNVGMIRWRGAVPRMSALGGMIGIGLGLAASATASHFLNLPFIPSPAIVVIAFVFSARIGIVFGYFPARRAARLDPIEALRHE